MERRQEQGRRCQPLNLSASVIVTVSVLLSEEAESFLYPECMRNGETYHYQLGSCV